MSRHNNRPTCPACGAELDRIVVLPQEIITCPACGLETSAHEWATHGLKSVTGFTSSSVIRSESSNGEIRWSIPAAGNAGVSISFWSCWCVIALVLAVFIGIKTIPEYGFFALLLQLSFPLPVLIVGLVFLQQLVARSFAKHTITLTKDALVIRREVLGRLKHSAFPRSRIRHIFRIPTRRSASHKHEAIEIRAGKQRVSFGEYLSPEEREKLVDEMRLRVFGPPVALPDAPLLSARLPDHFTFLITHRMLHNLPFAFAAMVFGSLFLIVFLRFMKPEVYACGGEEMLFFEVLGRLGSILDHVMRIVFIVISFASIAGGLWLLIHSLYKHLRQTAVETTTRLVIVRKLDRSGRTLASKPYPRNESTEMRTSLKSITGGVTLKRLELVDGNVSTIIVSDIRAEDAEEIMRRLASSDAAPASSTS
jgi:uncharacterized membrane protein